MQRVLSVVTDSFDLNFNLRWWHLVTEQWEANPSLVQTFQTFQVCDTFIAESIYRVDGCSRAKALSKQATAQVVSNLEILRTSDSNCDNSGMRYIENLLRQIW
jgi:hypothetical protein